MPLMPEKQVKEDDPALLAELEKIGKKLQRNQVNKKSKEIELDGANESMLVFYGAENITLLAPILEQLYADEALRSYTLPQLLTRFPFSNASVRRIRVEDKNVSTTNESGEIEEYRQLLLDGPLFPEVAIELCEMVQRVHGQAHVTFEVNPKTLSFNKFVLIAQRHNQGPRKESTGAVNSIERLPRQIYELVHSEQPIKKVTWTEQAFEVVHYNA